MIFTNILYSSLNTIVTSDQMGCLTLCLHCAMEHMKLLSQLQESSEAKKNHVWCQLLGLIQSWVHHVVSNNTTTKFKLVYRQLGQVFRHVPHSSPMLSPANVDDRNSWEILPLALSTYLLSTAVRWNWMARGSNSLEDQWVQVSCHLRSTTSGRLSPRSKDYIQGQSALTELWCCIQFH